MRLPLLAVLAASLAVPAVAEATIVPQEGMKGVRLGMTVEQVRDELGTPSRSLVQRDEIVGRVRVLHYGLTSMLFDGTKDSSKMLNVTTTSKTEKLSNGIGVGSTRAAVDSKVRRARCAVEFGLDHCYIGEFRAGRVVTDFVISSKGRVKSITVARVID